MWKQCHAKWPFGVFWGDDLTACICVFTGWSAERAEFLKEIASGGLETLALVLCRDRAEIASQLEETPIPCRHLLLDPPNVQEELFKL